LRRCSLPLSHHAGGSKKTVTKPPTEPSTMAEPCLEGISFEEDSEPVPNLGEVASQMIGRGDRQRGARYLQNRDRARHGNARVSRGGLRQRMKDATSAMGAATERLHMKKRGFAMEPSPLIRRRGSGDLGVPERFQSADFDARAPRGIVVVDPDRSRLAHVAMKTGRRRTAPGDAGRDAEIGSRADPTVDPCRRRVPGSWSRRYPTVSLGDQGLRRGIQAGTCSRYAR
jgi:hypothetical protein